MEWWTVFFRIRKIIYAFIGIASFGWAITLSIYLSREWSNFTHPQRGIVLGVIGVNGISAILLYLMIVVVFRTWLDFGRALFLLVIHVGASLAVTLFSMHFSCAAFATEQICKDVDLAFIIGSWVLTGLLLGYMIFLLIMSRVPRPVPRITPNLLLNDPEKAEHSRTPSIRSINSATGLLRQDTTSSFGTIAPSPDALPRRGSTPRAYYVANGMPTTPATARSPGAAFPNMTYGSTGSSARPDVPPLPRIQTSFSQTRRQSTLQQAPPQPLPLANPFADPLLSNNTPPGMMSALTFTADQPVTYSTWTSGSFKRAQYQPIVPTQSGSTMSASSGARMMSPGSASQGMDTGAALDSPTSIYSLYDTKALEPSTSSPQNPYMQPNTLPVWQTMTGPSLRTQTTTPHSFHSVTPSMHLNHPVPPPVHMRAGTEPVWRPHTADPHMYNDPPNHFGTAGSADVRRLPTMPAAQYQQRSGHGGTYVVTRNAAHLAGALGRTPPRTEVAVASREEWRQLVLRAASGGAL